MDDGEFIPLGFDYGCPLGECTNKFNSLNSETSPDSTTAMKNFLPKNWERRYKYSNSNMVGLNKKSKLVFARLTRGLRVKGVVCSNNYDAKAEREKIIKI